MADAKGVIKGFSNNVMPGSVRIYRYFCSGYDITEYDNGYIENVFAKDCAETTGGLDMASWIAKTVSDAAVWLTYRQNYENAYDVIETGCKADVESLLKVYMAADYQSSIV